MKRGKTPWDYQHELPFDSGWLPGLIVYGGALVVLLVVIAWTVISGL